MKFYRRRRATFVGLEEEVVFYDDDAFVQPIVACIERRYQAHRPGRRSARPASPSSSAWATSRNVDGHPKQLTSADPDFIDYYG